MRAVRTVTSPRGRKYPWQDVHITLGAPMAGHTFRACLVGAITIIAGCRSDTVFGIEPLPFAQAVNSCGPTDAPTVEVFLSPRPIDVTPVTPYLRVVFPVSIRELGATRFPVDGKFDAAYALKVEGSTSIVAAVSGELTVNAVRADSTVDGAIDVRFADGTRVRQSFLATWRGQRILCG
jgi:hypothetical protein